MTSYDFAQLSAYEFEMLGRDLLQKHLKIRFESFKPGRDRGIDLRNCSADNGRIIAQCKRYVASNFSSLFQECKVEAAKVELLNPSRYVLITSLGLSPDDKAKLLSLFEPYCQSTMDPKVSACKIARTGHDLES